MNVLMGSQKPETAKANFSFSNSTVAAICYSNNRQEPHVLPCAQPLPHSISHPASQNGEQSVSEPAQVHTSKKCLDCEQHPGLTSHRTSLQCVEFPELKRKMAQVAAFFSWAILHNMVDLKKNLKS